jgi:hypothetical protein
MKNFGYIIMILCCLTIACDNGHGDSEGIPLSIQGVWLGEVINVPPGNGFRSGIFFTDEEFGTFSIDIPSEDCFFSGDTFEFRGRDGDEYFFYDLAIDASDDYNPEFSLFLNVNNDNELTIRNSQGGENKYSYKEADNINQSETGCFQRIGF